MLRIVRRRPEVVALLASAALVWAGCAGQQRGVAPYPVSAGPDYRSDSLPRQAGGAKLTVKLHGVRDESGHLRVGLYDVPEDFPEDSRVAAGTRVPASPGTVSVQFEDLPPGNYAVAAFHDSDTDREIDTNWFGAPSEGWGMSNDVQHFMRVPSFEETSFEVGTRDKSIDINMNYY